MRMPSLGCNVRPYPRSQQLLLCALLGRCTPKLGAVLPPGALLLGLPGSAAPHAALMLGSCLSGLVAAQPRHVSGASTLLQHRLTGLQQGLLHSGAVAGGCSVPGSSAQRAPARTGGTDAHPAQREEAVHRELGQRAAVPQHHKCGHSQHHPLRQAAEHSVNLHQRNTICT